MAEVSNLQYNQRAREMAMNRKAPQLLSNWMKMFGLKFRLEIEVDYGGYWAPSACLPKDLLPVSTSHP